MVMLLDPSICPVQVTFSLFATVNDVSHLETPGLMIQHGQWMACSRTNWDRRSSERRAKPVASMNEVSALIPAWAISDWTVRDAATDGKTWV